MAACERKLHNVLNWPTFFRSDWLKAYKILLSCWKDLNTFNYIMHWQFWECSAFILHLHFQIFSNLIMHDVLPHHHVTYLINIFFIMTYLLCNSRWYKSEFSGDVCHNRQPYANCKGSAYEKLMLPSGQVRSVLLLLVTVIAPVLTLRLGQQYFQGYKHFKWKCGSEFDVLLMHWPLEMNHWKTLQLPTWH